jgi:hypothetical protein
MLLEVLTLKFYKQVYCTRQVCGLSTATHSPTLPSGPFFHHSMRPSLLFGSRFVCRNYEFAVVYKRGILRADTLFLTLINANTPTYSTCYSQPEINILRWIL